MVFRRTVAALALGASLLSSSIFTTPLIAKESECNIHQGPCTITSGSHSYTLNIEPKPVSAMKELTFSVTVTPCNRLSDKLLLDLSMPGMPMGKNQVTLIRKSGCSYEGKGIIVRCMSGRTLWKVTILADEPTNPAFIFNVR